jgi:predicted class III extradiol MEMO1 family dioxygenase
MPMSGIIDGEALRLVCGGSERRIKLIVQQVFLLGLSHHKLGEKCVASTTESLSC